MMNLAEAQTVGLIGLGGSGMRALAFLLAATGKKIVGTDADIQKLDSDPDIAQYTVATETEAGPLLAKADVIIYSDAVPAEHPLRQAARAAGKPEYMYSQALGEFSQGYITIAVTGAHGKSSTTAMLAHIMTELGFDPMAVVGAPIPAWGNRNARLGHSQYFVVEADEYRKHFLYLHPTHVIVTSIDFDHPDYFKSEQEVVAAYQEFLNLVPNDGAVITPESVHAAYNQLQWPLHTQSVPRPTDSLALALPGQHMQQNAALALAIIEKLGGDRAAAIKALASFPGLGRRFETVGHLNSLTVISDYGHHPAEIAATLKATRERFPEKKIVALIEPHTSERLDTFFDQYVQVLQTAPVDGLVICPTFIAQGRAVAAPDRHDELFKQLLAVKPQAVWELKSYSDLPVVMKQMAKQFTIAIGFTAGSLDAYLRQL